MKYNRFIACMANKDENSLFGLIPVIDDTMIHCMSTCVKYFTNMTAGEYNVNEEDISIEVVDCNKIAYHAILSYSDRNLWTFEHISKILAKSFIQAYVDENNVDCVCKLMKYINEA